MSLLTGKDGAVRELLSVPAGIGGAVKDLDGMYCGQDGANKMIFGRYRWEKWDTKTEQIQEIVDSGSLITVARGSEDLVIDLFERVIIKNGAIELDGDGISPTFYAAYYDRLYINYPYSKNNLYGCYRITGIVRRVSSYYAEGYVQSIYSRPVESKGENLLGTVQSDNPSSYPDNGVQDGYWYVRLT